MDFVSNIQFGSLKWVSKERGRPSLPQWDSLVTSSLLDLTKPKEASLQQEHNGLIKVETKGKSFINSFTKRHNLKFYWEQLWLYE